MNEHWFDSVHKTLAHRLPRRAAARAIGASAAFFHGGPSEIAAKKRRKRRKKRKHGQKDHGKGKGGIPVSGACSQGACQRAYSHPSQRADREWCEFICEQCDGEDPREFCILGDRDLPIAAVCCADGQTCCTDHCADLQIDDRNCGTCNRRCTPGKICFGGECTCQQGLTLCGTICRDSQRDRFHCGACGTQCAADEVCVNGSCTCQDSRPICNGRCCAAGSRCFGGEQCCPDDFIGPVCPGDPPSTCRPNYSLVCCDGFACGVGQNDPAGYYCYGHTSYGTCQTYLVEGGYPPLATYRYRE